jgi:hypothetical protein
MHYLVIIRHGEFTEGESKLNEKGKEQIQQLIPLLRDLHPVVHSSLGPRSIESAEIIAQELGIENEPKEIFGSNSRSLQSTHYSQAFLFLKEIKDNVVVVSKGEWADDFITYFSREYLHTEIAPISLERGSGVLINCERGEIARIPTSLTV